jgi:hypothetical protein
MKEFIGRVTYPLRFATSSRLTSAERLTHSSISFIGVSMSFVSTERGAVSFGVFDLSSLLDFLSFLDLAAGDLETREDLFVLKGESVRPLFDRPLRVRTPSLAVFERGVGAWFM